MTVARPPTMPSASWVIEWKWWNEKIPFRQSGSQPTDLQHCKVEWLRARAEQLLAGTGVAGCVDPVVDQDG